MNSKLLSAFLFFSLSITATAKPQQNDDGLSPLHLAAGRGDLSEVKKLLGRQSDMFSLDSKMGVSVLHKAVYSGNAEVVGFLLEQGALINLQSPSNGNTPLHDAIYFKPANDNRVIEAILERRPNVSIRNRAGLTALEAAKVLRDQSVAGTVEAYAKSLFTENGRALMAAVKSNDVNKVGTILDAANVAIDEEDEQGFTPLIWASREGFAEIVKLLLERKANPNYLDQWMRANAGHKAAFWGRANVIRLLIERGLDVNARGGYNGYTALHDAAARGHVEAAKILIERKARTDIKGHDGKTSKDIALSSGNPLLIEIFKEDRKGD